MDESLDFEVSFVSTDTSQNPPGNGAKEDEPPFICPTCKKEYKNLKHKKRHMEKKKCSKIARDGSKHGSDSEETNEALDETMPEPNNERSEKPPQKPVDDTEESNGLEKIKELGYNNSSNTNSNTNSNPDEAEDESDDEEFTMIDKSEVEQAENEEKRLKEEMEEEAEKTDDKEPADVEKVQVDVLELTTQQDEIDITLANQEHSDGECSDNAEVAEKKTDKPAAPTEAVEKEDKRILQPPVIHNRTFKMDCTTVPEQPVREWGSIIKDPANITTTLLKDLIDVKLSIEEDKKEEEKLRKSRTQKPSKEDKPVRTRSKEKKSKEKRKKREDEDNELDFEPGTESEDDSIDVKTGLTKDPTAFPLAPLEPVPKSRKEANRALLLTNLVRPFTILQLKAMLSHCGKVKSIWINTIKSRCYAVFASIEEATRARETIHGAVWPSTSPKTLNVDYAEDERMYSETDGELVGDNIDITVIEEQKRKKPKKDKERKKQKTDEDETPANILDTLFKKTKASPCIYWLPLSEEKAKEREEAKGKEKPRYFEPEPLEEEPKPRPRAIPKWSPARRAAAAERRDNRRRPRSSDRSRR